MDLMWVTRSIPIHFPLTTKKWILIFKSRLRRKRSCKKTSVSYQKVYTLNYSYR